MNVDIDQQEAAYNEYKARLMDPDCCEPCGGWLSDEPRAPIGRAHQACYLDLMFEQMGGYDAMQEALP